MILLCSFGVVFNANAQKEKKKKKAKTERIDRSNAFAPEVPEKAMAPAKKKTKKNKSSFRALFNRDLDTKKKEFSKRMEANAKEERKKQREMEKPQYSDPSYFGHKKKPKKRPPGKRKFCKECSIIH